MNSKKSKFLFCVILIFGLRTFYDSERNFIPHVMEFNMYVYSMSSKDKSTDLPDVSVVTQSGNYYELSPEKLSSLSLGYIHLADRWDFYSPLIEHFFCDKRIYEIIPANNEQIKSVKIEYLKIFKTMIQFEKDLQCLTSS